MVNFYVLMSILVISRNPVYCFRNMSSLHSIVFAHLDDIKPNVAMEYYFGSCTTGKLKPFVRFFIQYKDIENVMILRKWICYNHGTDPSDNYNLQLPRCVQLRGYSAVPDLMKYNPHSFNVCIVRLVLSYGSQKYTYCLFEWYIPVYIRKEISWELRLYL